VLNLDVEWLFSIQFSIQHSKFSIILSLSMDAKSLHCPNCGAAVDPEGRRCPYCQARLAKVSCPQCFALMFDGAAFCPHCGTQRARHDAQATDARCPGCNSALQELTIGSTALFECASCDGVWVSAEVFEQLCADREVQASLLPKLSAPKPTSLPAGPVRYRRCVRCGKMMNRVNFRTISATVIDVCKGHGTFLDAGELHQIVTFIQGGGLERARTRQMEDLKAEERRINALNRLPQRRGSRDGASSHSIGSSAGDAIGEGMIEGVVRLIDELF
jgi:Zn-finger nucleic acid-binding protein/predicted RNA-binding Zn-ribbon protein involved in translation (DUF1610 family)